MVAGTIQDFTQISAGFEILWRSISKSHVDFSDISLE